MKLGLIGLPGSGKTTLFNALTKSNVETGGYTRNKDEPATAEISVDDERIDTLSRMYQPRKTVYAQVSVLDFAGLDRGKDKQAALDPELIRLARNTDALAIVVRNFPNTTHTVSTPADDVRAIYEEFILSDLISVENRRERLEKARTKGAKTTVQPGEEKLMALLHEHLSDNKPIRDLTLSDSDKKVLSGFQFLSAKPCMIIVNSSDEGYGTGTESMGENFSETCVIECAGRFEMELSQLDDQQEIAAFMADMGIQESARKRLVYALYSVLGYISFFTVGDDEVRAWPIEKGGTALDAAATIHSDLARGFIRAVCFSFDDIVTYGSEKAVKEHGKLRLEGKDYLVQDGDILNIRFNV